MKYTEVQQLRKKAANDFWNFGAGRVANNALSELDADAAESRVLIQQIVDNKPKYVDPNAVQKFDEAIAANRKDIVDNIKQDVHVANMQGGIVGGMAGLAGGGLTYAGLGLIPGLKNRRGIRLLAGLATGVPLGVYVADRTAAYQVS